MRGTLAIAALLELAACGPDHGPLLVPPSLSSLDDAAAAITTLSRVVVMSDTLSTDPAAHRALVAFLTPPRGRASSYAPRMRMAICATGIGVALLGCGDDHVGPPWLDDPHIIVQGVGVVQDNCRDNICPHNENTDLTTYDGAIYLIHRTAESQILGPNCAMRVYKTTDGGKTWSDPAIIPGPMPDKYPDLGPDGRDLRDPSFDVVDGKLAWKALVRLPVGSTRDSNVDTVTVQSISPDGGQTWGDFTYLTPKLTGDGWSFWRIRDYNNMHYAAAYEDGDKSISLFSSPDGKTWTQGAQIYGVAEDTPLEPEIIFMPSGRMLALVRLDGTNDELLGNVGRLRTVVCWAQPPYDQFTCPQMLTGVRLDGMVDFFHDGRLWIVARKHFIEEANRKRTALYEITGQLEGGPIDIREIGELPSAGDTAYAGVADLDQDHVLVTWYSSSIPQDEPWARAILEAADIWQATLDMRKVPTPVSP